MNSVKLGARGPKVSTIGFGAWAIGGMNWGETDDDVSRGAINAALERGVTLIDTADVYGFGHSEELVAQVLDARGRPADVVVATKAGSDFYQAIERGAYTTDEVRPNYTKEYLIGAAEKSLKRLKVETLDILQLHSPGLDLLERDEPWEALRLLKRDGKIRHAGWSVQSFKETEQAHLLDLHGDLLDVLQVRYNMLEREAERVLFPKAQRYGIGVIVRIPLLFGLLTGKFSRESRFTGDDHRKSNLAPDKLNDYVVRFEALKPVFDKFPDQSMTQVALRFCISHPACHTAIPGAKTDHQVNDNIAASDLGPLPEGIVQEINRIQGWNPHSPAAKE
jgi:aryl-alcohol dehydrogenase-like predicted oxidoreductase